MCNPKANDMLECDIRLMGDGHPHNSPIACSKKNRWFVRIIEPSNRILVEVKSQTIDKRYSCMDGGVRNIVLQERYPDLLKEGKR